MYDEIVKRLRSEAECPDNYPEDSALMREAADAIEELSKPRWISVEERLPDEFVSVQAHMTDAEPFPSVREAYLAGGKWFFPALTEYHPVDKWAYFQEPPKEE